MERVKEQIYDLLARKISWFYCIIHIGLPHHKCIPCPTPKLSVSQSVRNHHNFVNLIISIHSMAWINMFENFCFESFFIERPPEMLAKYYLEASILFPNSLTQKSLRVQVKCVMGQGHRIP